MDWKSCLVGALFSLIIALFIHFIELKQKKLSYKIKTDCIISNKIKDIKGIEAKYNATEINHLYLSTITFKNIGNSIVEKTDFSQSDPISILTDGEFLFNEACNNTLPVFVNTETRKVCNKMILDFEFLSKKDTLLCTFVHTGNIEVSVTEKTAKLIDNKIIEKRNFFIRRMLYTLFQGLFTIIFCVGFFMYMNHKSMEMLFQYAVDCAIEIIESEYNITPK